MKSDKTPQILQISHQGVQQYKIDVPMSLIVVFGKLKERQLLQSSSSPRNAL
jgi:hypothetical protein